MGVDAAMEVCQLPDANATRALGRRLAALLLARWAQASWPGGGRKAATDGTTDRVPGTAKGEAHQRIPPTPAPPPLLLLQGDLGAGKTCLVQGLAEGLGITEPITSPTFALAHHYRGETAILLPSSGIGTSSADGSTTAARSVAPAATPSFPVTAATGKASIRVPTALVHLDLYRLEQPAAAAELLAQEEEEARALGAVLAVEWPERLVLLPEPCWRVELDLAGEGRVARLFGAGISGAS
ncbi:MAG: tRNA (adenosine(37)-N6)-threonylcarbamoyltransferase complex ATPase subunit type 1 TsaE [Cyanobacteriota bacterium]|jgi:tRNA threonylcarbamoyladenosine biosynthesis protein TsaE